MKLDEQKTLWDLTRGHRARYIAAIVSMGVSNVFLFGVPLVSRNAIDEVADGRQVPWLAAVAIVSLTAGAGAFQYLRGRWAATASEGIARAIRNRLFGHLERLPSAYHDRAGTGDLVQRCTSDVETVRVFLSGQVVEIGRSTLLFVMVVPVLLSMDRGAYARVDLPFPPHFPVRGGILPPDPATSSCCLTRLRVR